MSYEGRHPKAHLLPSSAPKLLPMPESCRFVYVHKSGYTACGCRQWGLMWCGNRDTAEAIWKERHMNCDPMAAVATEAQLSHG